MYCKYCGERIEDGSMVCRYCGKEQEGSGGVRIDMRGIGAGVGAENSISGCVGGTIRNVTIGGKAYKNTTTNVDNRGGSIHGSSIGSGDERIGICPYCGKELNFPKPPRFCPYCKEQIME